MNKRIQLAMEERPDHVAEQTSANPIKPWFKTPSRTSHEEPLLPTAQASSEHETAPLQGIEVNDSDCDGSIATSELRSTMTRPLPPFMKIPESGERSEMGKFFLGRPPNAHEALFWFDQHGPELIQSFIRIAMLLVAIYLPAMGFICQDKYSGESFGKLDMKSFIPFILFVVIPGCL